MFDACRIDSFQVIFHHMAKAVQVVINTDSDEAVIQKIASILRENSGYSTQVRRFAEDASEGQRPGGLRFQPKAGQILVCNFGLGFNVPENVKTRPVLVISPNQRVWTKLVVVAPISSKPPAPEQPWHFKLPTGTIPNSKYRESWIKGDMIVAVGAHRLDRLKTGFRKYESPFVSASVLKEARRCALHACGMHELTKHW